jgi:hypothetical protein
MAIMVMVVITEAITSGRLDVWLANGAVYPQRQAQVSEAVGATGAGIVQFRPK